MQPDSRGDSSDAVSRLVLFVIVLSNLLLCAWNVHSGSESIFDGNLFSGDNMLSLVVLKVFEHGGRLYSDVFYQYGPLYPTLLWQFSKLFESRIVALYCFDMFCLLIAQLCVVYVAHRNGFSTYVLLLLAIGCYVRYQGVFGSYAGLERVFFCLIVLFWNVYHQRTAARDYLLGAIFGALQWLKFGVGPLFLVSSALLDFAETRIRGDTNYRALLRSWLRIGIAAASFQSALILFAFAHYTPEIAWEQVFPTYFLKAYAAYNDSRNPFEYMDLGFFIGKQLPLILGGTLLLWYLIHSFAFSRSIAGHSWAILPVFYVLAGFTIFGLKYHFWGYDFAMLFSFFAFPHLHRSKYLHATVLLLLLFPVVSYAKNLVFPRPSPPKEKVVFPNNEFLYFSPEQAARHRALIKHFAMVRNRNEQPAKGIFIEMGFYHFFDFVPEGRHVYWLIGFPKPFDRQHASRPNQSLLCSVWSSESLPADTENWFQEANPFPRTLYQEAFSKAKIHKIDSRTFFYHFIW